MKLYLYSFVVFVIVLIAHYYGNFEGYYVSIWSYDIFMHLLGGIGMGLLASAFLQNHFKEFKNPRAVAVFFVIFIGIVWELFEAYYGIAGYPVGTKDYFLDTAKDLFDDFIGGFFIVWTIKKLSK